jgi:hypothetical protein
MPVSISTNADKIALHVRQLARKYPAVADETIRMTTQKALGLAQAYSALSDHSLADLRRMGHPYAARHELKSKRFSFRMTRSDLESGTSLRRLAMMALRGNVLGAAREGFRTRRTSKSLTFRGVLHPTATLPHPAYMIHRQGGGFFRAWRRAFTRYNNRSIGTVYNAARTRDGAPLAVFLEQGTSKMIARPILAKVADSMSRMHARLYRAAYYKIMGR